jgi:hypothetical protein
MLQQILKNKSFEYCVIRAKCLDETNGSLAFVAKHLGSHAELVYSPLLTTFPLQDAESMIQLYWMEYALRQEGWEFDSCGHQWYKLRFHRPNSNL